MDIDVELPAHLPYLKTLVDDSGGTADATDPTYQNAKGLWIFERASGRRSSVAVQWEVAVRIRHLASGKVKDDRFVSSTDQS